MWRHCGACGLDWKLRGGLASWLLTELLVEQVAERLRPDGRRTCERPRRDDHWSDSSATATQHRPAIRWGPIAAWLLAADWSAVHAGRCGCTFDDARAAGDRRRDELHAFDSSGWIKPQPKPGRSYAKLFG